MRWLIYAFVTATLGLAASASALARGRTHPERAASLAASGATMPALLQATRTVPIVFTQVMDPVGSGFVTSLAQPGGNIAGFTQFEFSMSGKWVELLKEIAPSIGGLQSCGMPVRSPGSANGAQSRAWRPR